jgi:hypothetical protein
MGTYTYPKFPYTAPADLQADAPQRRPLIIVGAGPVGLAAAIDARLKGLPVLVFDDDDTVSIGSRAVCYAKRALEVLDRLGVGDPLCDKGVSWNVGRTFFREKEVYRFDLVPDAGHKRPGMINLQQYYLEEVMVARALELGADIRWRYKVVGVQNEADHVTPARGHARRHLRHRGRLADRGRRRAQPDSQHAGPGDRGPHLHGPFPDRRRDHESRLPRRALVLVRPRRFTATKACCCTSRATTFGASTSSSAGMPTPRKKRSPRTSFPASRPCWATTGRSTWNGSASTPSSAGA